MVTIRKETSEAIRQYVGSVLDKLSDAVNPKPKAIELDPTKTAISIGVISLIGLLFVLSLNRKSRKR